MLSIHKRGEIVYNKKIVCNRVGLTPEITKSVGERLTFDVNNTWTITRLSQGIFLSWYSIDCPYHPLAWYHENNKSYFLSTPNKLDGHTSFWKGKENFGEIVNPDFLKKNYNPNYSWTFFLSYEDGSLLVSTVWDPEVEEFVPPNWIGININPIAETCPAKIMFKRDDAIDAVYEQQQIEMMEPLLVIVYCGKEIKTLKILSKEEINYKTIVKRTTDKFQAYLIALFKKENTSIFEKANFTEKEICKFWNAYKNAKDKFFRQIYEVDVLQKPIIFHDKLAEVIHLREILKSGKSCIEKQKIAWAEIRKSARGYRIQAITTFYTLYMKAEIYNT